MSALYRIRECRLADLRHLVGTMRAEDRSEIAGLGLSPRHALFLCWQESPQPRMAEVDCGDGWEIAAAWGDCGALLDPVGRAWLFTAPPIEAVPLAFFRETRREVAARLRLRRRLVSSVRADYQRALRFFTMAGFRAGDPVAAPPYGLPYHPIEIVAA